MFRDDKPLWMPDGSVRAIAMYILVIAAVTATFLGLNDAAESFLFPMASVSVGHYFGVRSASTPGDERG